ncbi:MAG: hypothetical protein V1867_01035 [Candidatus Falkowbacteria bacterium]
MIKIRHLTKKQALIVGFVLAGLVILGVLIGLFFKPEPKAIYEALIFAHNQGNDSTESLKSDMKIGDVLALKKQEAGKNLNWSLTERISYLILKMELTEEQAEKLTMPDEREIPKKEWSEEEKKRAEEEEARAKEAGREYSEKERRETLRPRLFRIRLEDKVFEGFFREQLMNGQPYEGMIFDWGIVEQKEKIK